MALASLSHLTKEERGPRCATHAAPDRIDLTAELNEGRKFSKMRLPKRYCIARLMILDLKRRMLHLRNELEKFRHQTVVNRSLH